MKGLRRAIDHSLTWNSGSSDISTVNATNPDFEAIAKALAVKGYEGWFVVEAEQDPVANPPLEMAKKGHKELLRVMAAAGYEVVK